MTRLRVLAEALRGRVTQRELPFHCPPPPEGYRGLPRIDPSQCMACGACTLACPSHALELFVDEEAGSIGLRHYVSRCIYCGLCSDVCPVEAMKLTEEYDMTTRSPVNLVQVVSQKGVRCRSCGRIYTSRRELRTVSSALRVDGYLEECPYCRRVKTARALAMGKRGW